MKSILRLSALLSVAMFFFIRPATAQYVMYMTIEGSKQGVVKVPTKQGKADGKSSEFLPLHSVKTVKSPRDPAIGKTSGARQHAPIVVTREVDEASPLLYSLSTSGELLKKIVIEYVGTEGPTKNKVTRRITLADAVLTKASRYKSTGTHSEHDTDQQEDLTFTFTAINIENLVASTSTTDDVTANTQ